MANRSIVRNGLQEPCVVSKHENLAEGNIAGKVVIVQQKQKVAQNAPLGYARPGREQVSEVTFDTSKV